MKETFAHNGILLEYEVSGEDAPLVFLHGLGGGINQIDAVYEPVEKVRLITLNQQGHGNSGVNWERYDFDYLADDVVALLDHLHLEKAVFAGISMGAAVCLNIAVRYPQRVEKMLLIRNAWTDKPMAEEVCRAYWDMCHPFEYGELIAQHIPGAVFREIPDKDSDAIGHKMQINQAIRDMMI